LVFYILLINAIRGENMTARSKTIVEGNEFYTNEYETLTVNQKEAETFQDWIYENMTALYELKLNYEIHPMRNGTFTINWWGSDFASIEDILNGEAEL
tara:strand:+ start:484 stop:777 length:294 start_codon:yes stop_codon:yes gene_type:complete